MQAVFESDEESDIINPITKALTNEQSKRTENGPCDASEWQPMRMPCLCAS